MRSAARPEQPQVRSRRRVGLAALTAGAAVVAVLAVPGTAYADPPSTTPTNVGVTGTSGTLTLHADSTAAQVQFKVDNDAPLTPVDVASGTASVNWDSWGHLNDEDAGAAHIVTAYDCTSGECNANGTSQPFSIENTAPSVTAPTGEIAPTGFTLTATSDSPAVRFRIDGNPVAGVYSLTTTYNGTALFEGPHVVTAVQCNADQSLCDGPESAEVDVTVVKLHPQIVSVSPNPFSPEVKDTTKVGYTLSPRGGSVDFAVINSSGATVRTESLGARSQGAHTWSWDGTNNAGHRVSDGTFRIRLTTTADIGGVLVTGTASGSVRVDTKPPSLSSVTAAARRSTRTRTTTRTPSSQRSPSVRAARSSWW